MTKACFRKLRRYKYQLTQAYPLDIGIKGYAIETPYLKLDRQGRLTIQKSYAWDGPSGPTFDTLDFMRGSLVHDALYQLIRLQKLPYAYKRYADLLLQKHCLEDGMSKFRSGYVYLAVKFFGGAAAKPGSEKPDVITCVPIK
jgi:hypothetical protein